MKCLNCDKEITQVLLYMFIFDGSDVKALFDFKEFDYLGNKGIVIKTDKNWTGYGLNDEERKECILCPECKKYPLDKEEEIQIDELIEIICFRK